MRNHTMKNIYRIAVILLVITSLTSCIVVKNDTIVEETEQIVNLSPKPSVAMSDEIVRSKDGDMIAFLPEGWFFVNVDDQAASSVFAVAVNPDYTLAAVFSCISETPEYEDIIKREGLIGLSRIFFDRHSAKTGGDAKMIGSSSSMSMGPLEFGRYNFSTAGGSNLCRSAVFKSSMYNLYEISVIQMEFRLMPLPTQNEIEQIFSSIVATIQY